METKLSKNSRTFLENLRLYLVTSGKRESEIEEIIDELRDHLLAAEADGKSTDNIIGQSPKDYMEQLSNEMATDYKGWMKYVPVILFGLFAYIVLGDVVKGELHYSVLQLIGYPVIGLLFIFLTVVIFKYIAGDQPSLLKESSLFYLLGLIPIGLFIGLIYLDQHVTTPEIHFGTWGMVLLTGLSAVILIGESIWSKTWLPILLPILSYLPDILLDQTHLNETAKILFSVVILFGGIGIYIWIVWKRTDKV